MRFKAPATLAVAALGPFCVAPLHAHAPAPITHCRLIKSLIPPNSSDANHIRIQIRERKIDDYLPRCDLATFVAAAAGGQRRIVEKGARWYVGAFTCSYRYRSLRGRDEMAVSTRCVHRGRYASTVWFDWYA